MLCRGPYRQNGAPVGKLARPREQVAFHVSSPRRAPSQRVAGAAQGIGCWFRADSALLLGFLVRQVVEPARRMPLAGAATSAGAGAAAPPPAPAVPWLLVGRRVRRAFAPAPGADLRNYDGIIIAVRAHPSAGTLWRVHYDEDGDSEDLISRRI